MTAQTKVALAKAGKITEDLKIVAQKEHLSAAQICNDLAKGTLIIPKSSVKPHLSPMAIGKGTSTKININLGTSSDKAELEEELEKVRVAIKFGADTIMDLSTGGDLDDIRRRIVEFSTVPVGSVPIYQAARDAKHFSQMTEQHIMRAIEAHCKDGIDYITVHTGITREGLQQMNKQGRITDVVSRGGGILAAWMQHHSRENPMYEAFDEIVEIAAKYDTTLSLGDSLRPGCLHDATDKAQLHELKILGQQHVQALKENVQSMVEGPGHVPFNQIAKNVRLQKKYCYGAPFYVLGPLVTDIAPGYDHITGSMGGLVAAAAGADFLCYVTPAEHLRLPTVEDVKEGTIAFKIAAHAADVAKGFQGAREWDDEMSKARKAINWERMYQLALDPEKAKAYHESMMPHDKHTCAMCGTLCSMKITSEYKV